MQWLKSLIYLLLFAASAPAQSTEGLYSLVKRRLPNHIDHIHFTIDKSNLQAPRVMTNLWSPVRQMAQSWSRAIPYRHCHLGIHVEIVLCGASFAY
jgi:hypothetical protein